jgi:hypothetical protein
MQALRAPAALRALRACPDRSVRSRSTRARAAAAAASAAPPSGRLLLLGGTGFVGTAVAERALAAGWAVTSISRRGRPADGTDGWPPRRVVTDVDWRAGDATDPDVVRDILAEGGFNAVVHAIGMLLDSDLNRFASGSGA